MLHSCVQGTACLGLDAHDSVSSCLFDTADSELPLLLFPQVQPLPPHGFNLHSAPRGFGRFVKP